MGFSAACEIAMMAQGGCNSNKMHRNYINANVFVQLKNNTANPSTVLYYLLIFIN